MRSQFASNFILKDLKLEVAVIIILKQALSVSDGKTTENAKKSVAELYSENYQ